MFRKIPQLFSV